MAPKKVILGISPGTRFLAFAVMQENELIDWGLKTFKGPWSDFKCRLITNAIEKLCSSYQVTHISLKRPHSSRSSRGLEYLLRAVQDKARNKQRQVKIFTINDLKAHFNASKNCEELAQHVTRHFPELNRQQLSLKTAEAIAAAMIEKHP